MAVLACINTSAVYRLKFTRDQLPNYAKQVYFQLVHSIFPLNLPFPYEGIARNLRAHGPNLILWKLQKNAARHCPSLRPFLVRFLIF